MARVLGIDGDKRGWIGVVLDSGSFASAHLEQTLDETHAAAGAVDVITIDMPIGWVNGVRAADGIVRSLLPGRTSSVFNAPTAQVRDAATYRDALSVSEAATGRGLSKQSWALVPKIRDATEFAQRCASTVAEAHPELAFAVMAGGQPVAASKYTWGGHNERRSRLRLSGIVVPDDVGPAGAAGIPDVLDAAAIAWTAERIRRGAAESHPDPPEVGDDDVACAIWV